MNAAEEIYYRARLVGLSAQATIVESRQFSRLFTADELANMEPELRDAEYEPKPRRGSFRGRQTLHITFRPYALARAHSAAGDSFQRLRKRNDR